MDQIVRAKGSSGSYALNALRSLFYLIQGSGLFLILGVFGVEVKYFK